jgi:isochorismate hydrolase
MPFHLLIEYKFGSIPGNLEYSLSETCYNFFMKEAYFTPDTIQTLSREWMERYSRPNKSRRQPFDIQEAALIILDMQRYFLDEASHAFIPSGRTIVPGLKSAAAYFRKMGRPVIGTQHINSPQDARMMASWWSEVIKKDHQLAGLEPDLDLKPQEIVPKTQYDAFFESSLGSRLREEGVSQVVIGGVMTHLCCETTARAAFGRGFEVFFLVDGTATYHRDFHQASLLNLAHGVAVLTTIEEIIKE